MKVKPVEPPRSFKVGHPGRELTLTHAVDLELGVDEQVTIRTERGGEYDVVRKDWGFYATPSLNGRLKSFGYRSVLVESMTRRFLLLVETDRMADFEAYIDAQGIRVIAWLDGPEIEWVAEGGPA